MTHCGAGDIERPGTALHICRRVPGGRRCVSLQLEAFRMIAMAGATA